MTQQRTVAVLVGSLRKASFSRLAAAALAGLAPKEFDLKLIEIGNLPLYNQDDDDDNTPPAAWSSFREAVKKTSAVLFVTPEYNRSVPGILKNAIDVGSRPYGMSVWEGKPAAVMSISPGALGGFGANHHLRQSLVFLNMPVLQQPEAYIGGAAKLFAEDGTLSNQGTADFFGAFVDRFVDFIRIIDR